MVEEIEAARQDPVALHDGELLSLRRLGISPLRVRNQIDGKWRFVTKY
jgi:hypothetical protein